MTELRDEFGRKLRSLREAQGLSVGVLAEMVGVSRVTIWNWEKGDRRPSARMIPSLAKALQVMPVHLRSMDGSADDSPEAGMLVNPEMGRPDPFGQPELLSEVIARAKQMIADASGASLGDISIQIEY